MGNSILPSFVENAQISLFNFPNIILLQSSRTSWKVRKSNILSKRIWALILRHYTSRGNIDIASDTWQEIVYLVVQHWKSLNEKTLKDCKRMRSLQKTLKNHIRMRNPGFTTFFCRLCRNNSRLACSYPKMVCSQQKRYA